MTRLQATDTPQRLQIAIPSPGKHQCVKSCGVSLPYPGVCPKCLERELETQHNELLAPARASIPERFRWAHWSSNDWRTHGIDLRGVKAAHRANASGKSVVLLGPTYAGKSSIAAAMLREVIDVGAYQAAPQSQLAYERAVQRARFARFVPARKLTRDAHTEDRYIVERAMLASVLVLDDLGKELDGCPAETPLAAQRMAAVNEVIEDRLYANRRTIVTTWMSEAQVRSTYGGGSANRLFKDAIVIQLNKS